MMQHTSHAWRCQLEIWLGLRMCDVAEASVDMLSGADRQNSARCQLDVF